MIENWQYYCEYQKNPIGIENQSPRFLWLWVGENDIPPLQRAYRLRIWTKEMNPVWDSGLIECKDNMVVKTGGGDLLPAEIYLWNVDITLADGSIVEGPMQTFEMGLMSQNWGAKWISNPNFKRGVAPLFRRQFRLNSSPKKGRLYCCGLGYAEVSVNGKRVDDSVLDPGCSQYAKTLLYRAWDITHLLKEGDNVLAVELGEGWYGLECEIYKRFRDNMPSWLDKPKLYCRLVADDTVIVSDVDGNWMVSEGAVIQNSIFDGEIYDSRAEKAGWNLPEYSIAESEWRYPISADSPGGKLRCQIIPPIRETERIRPVYIDYPKDTNGFTFVIDLGVNIAGWAEIDAEGQPGQKIRLRFSELKRDDGNIDQRNLLGVKAEDTYIFGQSRRITWHPRFTYHGFRYVEISFDPGVIVYSVCGIRVNTDVERTGYFYCGNQLLNKIYDNVIRTEQNNLHSIPTDCPQRFERQGWLNDAAVRSEEAICNFDMMLFFEKWLQDISDEQDDAGAIADTAPFVFGTRPALHISSTYIMLPWFLYVYYGDIQPAAKHYDGMRRYVLHKLSTRNDKGLLPETMYIGDWAAPLTVSRLGSENCAVPANVSHSMLSTSYLYYDCILMERIASCLNNEDDAEFFRQTAIDIREAINSIFLNENGGYGCNSQGENAFALFLDLPPEERRDKVLENLLDDLRNKNNWHVTTGNQMTKYLFEVLGKEGLVEDAYRILCSEDYPSLGFMVKNGATTIWERWEYLTSDKMNSHNHPMLGAFSVWFQKYLAGIRIEWLPERRFQICVAPQIPKELNHAGAALRTPWGKVSCDWRQAQGQWEAEISVPWNTEIAFFPPFDGNVFVDGTMMKGNMKKSILLKSGKHRVKMANGKDCENEKDI